ncbi:MAG TPA: PQQ-dependent sugar dehydrogenase [Novosphingobium sp.]|nr:PQQ-dependent sugar dehydrogenase [Novosphingobium sp.]
MARIASSAPFATTEVARFAEPWALAFLPGEQGALITERRGKLKWWRQGEAAVDVAGVPAVDYGGQGGLGDVVLAPDFATSGIVYLSWAEAGEGDTRGAAVGQAKLVLSGTPRLEGLRLIWRQSPKVAGRGHYSHRIAFSPDGKYLFIASGERQKFTPAQDVNVNLGKIVRLLPDGTPAPGNPFAERSGPITQLWTLGHRNILGLKFDAQGRLWDLEHGPQGGDELNLVTRGQNYGWPVVSNGDNYDGTPIPRHTSQPEFAAPAISWNPVIAPGDFIFYSGSMFPEWRGQAIIAGMVYPGLVRVGIEGESAKELARYPLDSRIREIAQAADGAIWVLEDGPDARLLRLSR